MKAVANPEVLPWRNGVIATYFASGLVISTLVARLPSVRDALGLSHGEVGLLLLCMTAGSFLSVSASGFIVMRLGSKRTLVLGATLASLAMAGVGIGSAVFGSVALTGLALALQGMGTASWNVASNVQGAAMERALGKGIMPALHGFFSVGTVVGAAAGAIGAATHLSIAWHFGLMALVVLLLVHGGARTFGPDATSTGSGPSNKALLAAAWREPRTLVLGLLVLGMALAEGAAGDWVALALSDGYGSANTVGALGYGVFVTAMTTARMLGGRALDRFGRVLVMRVSAASALAGLLLFVFGPSIQVAMAALVLWGLGVALSFPIAMTAASDDPMRAAARVSVVSTIGYGAFLGGPPLLGLLADRIGLLNALASVGVLVVMSFVLAGATAPVHKTTPEQESTPERKSTPEQKPEPETEPDGQTSVGAATIKE
ncbi:MFS family permease [Paeniglutamicibacter kerguelensis]|uniref:MFS family permease n=1 Tax=Paeniglutamicibacter kerguelensis TaxID=254788 RepID=A0ABS4XES2_9MICC|nr:MFS family permease [Paeniglutamicibacter kerguelensis]